MTTRSLRTVFTGGSYFEGPRWHEGAWWVSDFYTHGSPGSPPTAARVVTEVEAQPSGLGWLPDGTLLVVSMGPAPAAVDDDGCARTPTSRLLRRAAQRPGRRRRRPRLRRRLRLRPHGRRRAVQPKRVDPDGTVTVVAEDLHFPNGTVITPDGGTLVVGETWGNRFTAFDLAADGSLTNRRVWAEFGPLPQGTDIGELVPQVVLGPDGCTLDADGHIWVADGFHGRVARVAPGGAIAEEIAAPGGMGVFACALGGEDGRTLLMCCAPDFLEHNRAPVREAVLGRGRVDVPHAEPAVSAA